jgi:hypothetical protein
MLDWSPPLAEWMTLSRSIIRPILRPAARKAVEIITNARPANIAEINTPFTVVL